MNKIEERLRKLPHVAHVDQDSDGIWVHLKDGWQFADNPQCHTAHEDNWFSIQSPLRKGNVIPCDCKQCRHGKELAAAKIKADPIPELKKYPTYEAYEVALKSWCAAHPDVRVVDGHAFEEAPAPNTAEEVDAARATGPLTESHKRIAALKDEVFELHADVQSQKSVSSCLREELSAAHAEIQALKKAHAGLLAAAEMLAADIYTQFHGGRASGYLRNVNALRDAIAKAKGIK